MGGKICTKCKNVHPATTEYFYKNKGCIDGLNTACKACQNAQSTKARDRREKPLKRVVKDEAAIKAQCETCQKYNSTTKKCKVMTELIPNCWAWTNDRQWGHKVKSAVIMYKAGRGQI